MRRRTCRWTGSATEQRVRLFLGVWVCTTSLLFGNAALAQIGRSHVPPTVKRPFLVHAELIEWTGAGEDDSIESVPGTLEAEGDLPDTLHVVSEVSGHAIRSYTHRLSRAEQSDLLLTFVSRDHRRVRALLEEEGAPTRETRTLELRLDRSYGSARGRLVTALGPRGPWLRIDLNRP